MAKDKDAPAQADVLVQPHEQELRDKALRYALQFHSNNGGMLTPDQLLANAQKFTKYLKEETNV